MSATLTQTLPPIELTSFAHELPPTSLQVPLQPLQTSPSEFSHAPQDELPSMWKTTLIIATLSTISLIGSMAAGMLIVTLPTMARDIHLANNLLLWPASVSNLTSGCTLLLFGSIADVVGGRKTCLAGTLLLVVSMLAIGLCRTGIELILLRSVQGVSSAMVIPAAVILVTSNIPEGRRRNAAFAVLGAAQPLGFACGLVLGGLFAESIGWRWGFYLASILTFVIFVVLYLGIPAGDDDSNAQSASIVLRRIKTEIDWVGISILSSSLGLLSYVLSVLASAPSNFVAPVPLTLCSIGVLLLPVFAAYSRHQERHGKKVIIPPSIWNNRTFTCLCLTIFIMFGVFDVMLIFLTLFFQSVQGYSTMATSIRFLPIAVSGFLCNVATGYLVPHVPANILILCSTALSSLSPLLMALTDPSWSFWTTSFFAVLFTPTAVDVLFTVANLVITRVYPPATHGLAGGVFNTISNIGNSFALALGAVIASSVTTAHTRPGEGPDTPALLAAGYHATFWTCFGACMLAVGVVALGMRGIGRVGVKRD